MRMDKKHVKPHNVCIYIYMYPTLSNTKLNNNGLIGLIDPERLRARTSRRVAELSCSDMAWPWGPSPKIRPPAASRSYEE